jgi:hypothetical protein
MKRCETPQNMSRSNRVDRVRLLWKIPTQFHSTNLCISSTSSAYFAPTFVVYQNGLKHPKAWVMDQMGYIGHVHYEKFRHDFVARTCALIAPVRRVLHRLSSIKGTVRNTPKHKFRVQLCGSVRSLRKVLTRLWCMNLFINCTVRPILHRLSCSNETVWNIPKYEIWVQYGESGVFIVKNTDMTSLHELVH